MAHDAEIRLLIDQNLPAGLARHLRDVYPGSRHVRDFGQREASDELIWQLAIRGGFVIVTKDSDFGRRSRERGHPPKVIRIRLGNCSKLAIERLLCERFVDIVSFVRDRGSGLLEIP